MDKNIAIKITKIHKSFKLPHEPESTIKSKIVNPFKKRGYEKQQVLKDINFEIKKGDFFGIVGRNGSGKSTLLKLIAGIYSPDEGAIEVDGKLTPFIELGVGFNPELTGRENVYLNGALLGFSRKEMSGLYDEIVDFAELHKFMDQKLKNYSSGMQVRLAFSIAIQANSDILVLDEVLAVGDEAFQRKCINIFENYKASGKTIVLVTHDMGVVEKYCNNAVLISDGEIKLRGSPRKISKRYSEMNEEKYIQAKSKKLYDEQKNKYLEELGVRWEFKNSEDKNLKTVNNGEKLELEIRWSSGDIKNIGIALVKDSGEYLFGTNTFIDKIKIDNKIINYSLNMNVGQGDYKFIIGLFGDREENSVGFIEEGPKVVVKQGNERWQGVTNLDHEWYK